jgi:MFS family permease
MGPRLTAILAAILMSSGYGMIYMAAAHWFPTQYWVVGCFYLVFAAGESASFTAAMATSIKNFNPKHRGKVSGFMSCVYGIASAIYSGLFKFVFQQDLMRFLLFLSFFAGIVPLISGLFLNVVPKDYDRKRRMQETAQLEEERRLRGEETPITINAIDDEAKPEPSDQIDFEEMSLLKKGVKSERLSPAIVVPNVNESLSPWKMIQTIDFYLFCAVIFAGMGTGQAITNNLGAAVVSYGGSKDIIPNLLIINSIASATGRIVLGYMSDRLSNYAIRPTFLNICVLSLGCVSFGFAFTNVPLIYVLTFFSGFSYGGINAVIIAYLADRFGPQFLGMNNTICKLGALLANYLLATVLASIVYQAHIKGNSKTCHGRGCYLITFLTMSCLCLAVFLSTLFLMHRNQDMYAEIRKKHIVGKKVAN